MLRNSTIVLMALSLTALAAGYAPADTFVDLSSLASYYQAFPCSVSSSSGALSLQGYISGSSTYFHTYLYTGGTAGTMNVITSNVIGGAGTTAACAMNDSGQIAAEGNGTNYGYVYSGGTSGTLTSYRYSGNNTESLGIASNGDGGGFYISGGFKYPYVYTGGTAYGLNRPAGDSYTSGGAGIVALNTSGQAVGWTTPSNPANIQGAVWTYTISGGSVTAQTGTDIKSLVQAQFPTAQESALVAINSSGKALGVWGTTYSSSFAGATAVAGCFIYNVNTTAITPLDGLLDYFPIGGSTGYEAGQGQLINDSGVVVGRIVDGTNSTGYSAAIWENGVVTNLNTRYGSGGSNILPSGFVLDFATAIDNIGDIGGYGHDATHSVQAFVIYHVVPEPGALTLLATGLAGLLACAWRKRK